MDWTRFAKPTPVRPQDLVDALDHVQDLVDRPLSLSDFAQSPVKAVPIDDLWEYDDLSSWPEWQPRDLIYLDADERFDELVSFRGEAWAMRAARWTPVNMPPIVLVETREGYAAIGDGRGRVSYAIGMGFAKVPAVVLRER